MRVLLVKPPGTSDSVQPPLGLAYIAAVLSADGHEVAVLDGLLENMDKRSFQERLWSLQPGLVGFQCLSHDIASVKQLAESTRNYSGDCKVVVGGPHPTCTKHGGLDYFGDLVDYAFRGEAEPGFPMLIKILESGNEQGRDLRTVPGLAYREGGAVRVNAVHRPDLKDLPLPRWDLLKPETYPPSPNAAFFQKWPTAPIITSRGCNHHCSFCAASIISGSKVRYRPIESVLEEIGVLRERGIQEIHIEDDSFTSDRNYVETFCDAISSTFPDLAWACPNGVRIDTLDLELLKLMKKSGCHEVSLGVESGSQRILDRVGKGQTLGEVRAAVEKINKAGMVAIGFFIIGFPGESIEEAEETIRFSLSLPLRRANFMLFRPLPGTGSWVQAGKPLPDTLPPSFAEVSYVPAGWSARGLKKMQRKAFLKFYMRPGAALHLVTDIRSPGHFLWIAKRIFRWMISTGQKGSQS
ncbi:MAG: B12-binding domain-containing radical SAM protein [Deltaproteobacteria bacterium]|nr:B12-binding domain-containing radical SAM protein [Deltaproteobacteria bacterium]